MVEFGSNHTKQVDYLAGNIFDVLVNGTWVGYIHRYTKADNYVYEQGEEAGFPIDSTDLRTIADKLDELNEREKES